MTVLCPNGLKKAYRDGCLIPFVGAGASMSVSWSVNGEQVKGPSWGELVERATQILGFDSADLARIRGTDLQVLEYFKIKHAGQTAKRRRRDTGYPAPPAQIPASGFPAPGSSVLLTRAEEQAIAQAPDSHLPRGPDRTRERQTLQQPVQSRPVQASPLTSSIQPLVQQPYHLLMESP